MSDAEPIVPARPLHPATGASPAVSAAHAAGRRAMVNTAFRAAGELLGKLGTFVVFAVMTRTLGASDVGAYVVAFAYVQVVMVIVNLGLDRLVLRRVALDVRTLPAAVTNVSLIKLAAAVPVCGLSWVAAWLVGYDSLTRLAIVVLSFGLLLDAINTTLSSALSARERGGLLSISISANRLVSAVLGIGALAVGFGVIAVCVTYAVGSAIGILFCLRLLAKHVRQARGPVLRDRWPALVREGLPFALYDSLGFLFSRVDAVVLSALATQATVGLYGAASRVYEASTFLTFSINGAFAAMFTYLTRDSEPTVGAIFERSVKLALLLLVPLAVAFGTRAEDFSVLLFGEEFRATGDSLRLLAPSIALLGVANLSTTLVALRVGSRALLPLTGGALGCNIILCLVLVPPLGAPGAGLAMSLSLAGLAIGGSVFSAREVGGVRVVRTLVAPLAAGVAMAATMHVVGPLLPALVAGGVAYLAGYVAVERVVSPADLQFAVAMIRRRITR